MNYSQIPIPENLSQLSIGQRAMLAEKAATATRGRKTTLNVVTIAEAAKVFGSTPRAVNKARTIRKWAPEEARQVEAGTMKLEKAYAPFKKKGRVKPPRQPKIKPPKKTRYQQHLEMMNNVPKLRGLARDEVDPNFKGDALAFATEYGHVPLQTKEQRERDRDRFAFSAWIGKIKKITPLLEELLEIREFSQPNLMAWVQRVPDKQAARYKELLERLNLIKRVAESVTGHIEWLEKNEVTPHMSCA